MQLGPGLLVLATDWVPWKKIFGDTSARAVIPRQN
ncbi:hypothetical protein PF003_g22057 [Phytophthora fragariae]|nr:hypothetical protein PF003_g22057 [Phytophthora fragariae]